MQVLVRQQLLCLLLLASVCQTSVGSLNIIRKKKDETTSIHDQLNDKQEKIYVKVSTRECMTLADRKGDSLRKVTYVVKDIEHLLGRCVITTPGRHPCDTNPCKHGECMPSDSNNNNFTCECEYPFGGKMCDELVCENCYQYDDWIIAVDDSLGSLTWQQSYDNCQSKGMRLFLDKSKDKHDFVTGILSNLHPNVSEKICYWIGMYRMSREDNFKYTDDTPVTADYTMWSPSRPDNNNCVNIANGEPFYWKWDDDPCEGVETWKYSSLCEMTFPSELEISRR